ncbi:MAG: hypothetical protein J6Y52_05405 [Bacteroidales bacterium]|nr:hypothetical protein [Bacteroidales bacterium]
MKTKSFLMLMIASAAVILSSCTTTYPVTARSTFDKTVEEIKSDLAKQGFAPSGSSTETKNNVYVEGTSYSRYSGYGSKMANDFVTTDTYRFSHEDGSTMSFSVSYKANRDETKGLIYVTEVSTAGCEASNAKQYDALCGSNSPVKKLNALPQDAFIEKTDVLGTTLLVTGLTVLGTILIYAVML